MYHLWSLHHRFLFQLKVHLLLDLLSHLPQVKHTHRDDYLRGDLLSLVSKTTCAAEQNNCQIVQELNTSAHKISSSCYKNNLLQNSPIGQ